MRLKSHVRFGGGRTEKEPEGQPEATSLAAYPTVETESGRFTAVSRQSSTGLAEGPFRETVEDGFEPRRHLSPSHWGD